jgi:hypothetical protein
VPAPNSATTTGLVPATSTVVAIPATVAPITSIATAIAACLGHLRPSLPLLRSGQTRAVEDRSRRHPTPLGAGHQTEADSGVSAPGRATSLRIPTASGASPAASASGFCELPPPARRITPPTFIAHTQT